MTSLKITCGEVHIQQNLLKDDLARLSFEQIAFQEGTRHFRIYRDTLQNAYTEQYTIL